MGAAASRPFATPAPTGTLIAGRYRVEAHLGRGGMGSVFRVTEVTTGRPLALKRISLPPGVNERRRTSAHLSFRREFHTLVQLRHPRIVEVYDYGVERGEPYYTMELLDGSDLFALKGAPPDTACRLLRDVAVGLAFLHSRRFVHRDLSPRNVRCTADGRAKLIDFGVLATVGLTGNLAGTPPFVAPESMRGLPLDPRVDLYGLGALAYWLVTGQHAFPARVMEDLEELWRARPRRPRELRPEVPEGLDELIMALLSGDPLARPATAAELIDRLGAIAKLSPVPEVEEAKGYLSSAALVGRNREMEQLRRCVEKAVRGSGQAVLIEAPSGTGKSRLLHELALEAQVSGLITANAGSSDEAGRGPYGVLRALGRSLLASAPVEATDAARAHAPIIARVIPEVGSRIGPVELAAPAGDPAEERMRLQAALAAWLADVTKARPVALLVDDVQRCDEASAAVLAALAHDAGKHRLLVGIALRTDETVRAQSAVAAMRDAGARIRLRGLDLRDVEALCRALFGDVPNLPILARWMHKLGGGSPLHSTELARHLVDRGIVRFVEGFWVVPEHVTLEDLPAGLTGAMDARIAALQEAARSLAEALSVHGGELTLELCTRIGDGLDEAAVFAALDELRLQEVLIGTGTSHTFRHDGLREALLRGLPDERRRYLHRLVGEALASDGAVDAEHEAEVGWHLLRGGDERRGAELLERAGRRLYDAQSFSDSIAPLEAALEVYERPTASAASPRLRLELKHTLLMAGVMCDRPTALRHADSTVAGYRRYAGVAVAERLGPWVGKVLGLLLALSWAWLGWLFTRPSRRGPTPVEALGTFFVVSGYAAVTYSIAFAIPRVRELVRQVEPVAVFEKRVPYAVYLLTRNLLLFPLGHFRSVRKNADRLLTILETDRLSPIREIDRRTGEGGARYMLAIIAAMAQDTNIEAELAKLSALNLRFFDLGVLQARVANHRLRGEEEKAQEVTSEAEVMFVQLGSMWQLEALVPVLSAYAYAFTRDVLGLKRTIEILARLIREGYGFEQFIDHARGEYHRERGDFAASRDVLERAIAALPPDEKLIRQPAMGALAETLLAAGDLERAKEVARATLAFGRDPEVVLVHATFRAARTLALAEAAQGNVEEAAKLLDRAIEEARATSIPSVMGSLHEGRARVAAAARDGAELSVHLAEMDRWFRPTRNPALIARCERLAELQQPELTGEAAMLAAAEETVAGTPEAQRALARAAATALEPTEASASRPRLAPTFTSEALLKIVSGDAVTLSETSDPLMASALMSGCRGGSERAARALELLALASSAASGYLYLVHEGGIELAAPAYGDEPPPSIDRAIRSLIVDGTAEDAPTMLGERDEGRPSEAKWRPLLLRLALPDRTLVVGAVGLLEGAIPLEAPDPRLVDELARLLYQAGDVSTAAPVDLVSVSGARGHMA